MTEPSSRVAALSAKKRALLAQRFRSEGRSTSTATISRRESLGPVRLSFAQERLWFLDRWQPGSSAYNLLDTIQLLGRLNVPALSTALGELRRRHESLRTVFRESEGIPYQVVVPATVEPIPLADLSTLPAGRRQGIVQAFASDEGRRPFDLSRGPVLRARLLKMAEGEHFLVLVLHHIASDLWSFGVLIRELGALYNRFCSGGRISLPDLEIQYPDFAVWQRNWLQGEVLANQLSFWKRQLQGAPTVLELPTDRPRPAVQTSAGRTIPFTLPAALLSGLRGLGQEASGTLFMVLWAGFAFLLSRYSGQSDVLAGTPVAGRTRRELEPLIGLFVNTLVLRANLAGDPSFLDLLRQARDSTLGAFSFQELPFEKLVEELLPDRDAARAPLVQVLLTLQNVPRGQLALEGLTFTPLFLDKGTAKLDLSLFLTEEDGALLGTCEYNTDLFDVERIQRLLCHFKTILGVVAATPGLRLSTISLLEASERRQLLTEWNDSETLYPEGRSLHRLFEAQVERSPEAIAIRFEQASLTYRELDRTSNQWARRLRSHGVEPEEIVGVLLDRSPEMVVALFSVLKAGGAYLPLDPSYPQERLDFFIEDAAPRMILTVSALAVRIPPEIPRICLNEDRAALDGAERPRAPGTPENLAYVIYTSGSTGRPKGAMNAHRGIVNRIQWMQHAYELGGDDTVLQKTPFSFDVSVWEFFWPLAVGARLVLAQPGRHGDPSYLVEVIEQEAITTLHFVPSMLQAFLDASGLARCISLKRVIASGEELPVDVASRFLGSLGWAGLHNLYGPTEAAVDVTSWACRRESSQARVPIGRPIANLQIYLLDSWEPVPIGVPGELFIGGVGVGRGYLRRPEMSAERFVPDPFSSKPGTRLYRTGDLVRQRSDGAVEFLRRMDHQIKIRGFRIELGEIEVALAQAPGVKAAVVGVCDIHGDRQLVAYLVASEAGMPEDEELRQQLRARLPAFMLPSRFVALEAMPLSPNGKADRKALARLATELERTEDRDFRHTPLQELLVGIWAEVLGLERVGLRESFFELGGHSLRATRVVSRIREVLGIELPLRALFETPTLLGLSQRLEEMRRGGRSAAAPSLQPAPRNGQLPLSFAQEGMWFLDRLYPGSAAYNMPAAFRFQGAFDVAAFAASYRELVRRHESLRTTFRRGPEGPEQVLGAADRARLAVVDLTALPEKSREITARQLAEAEAVLPFDLEKGPLLRVRWLHLAAEDSLLLCNMHHATSDGWSMGIFVQELAAFYRAALSGCPAGMPELPIQYVDYAIWQRSWLQGKVLEEHIEYWRRQLAGAPPLLELPWDRPRGGETKRRAARDLILDLPLAHAAHAASRKEQITFYMLLLGSFQVLLHRLSGQEDLCVGTPIAGRNHLQLEGLIGLFVNTLVLRSVATGGPTFRELLARVRSTTLDAYQFQELPFEKLVEELQPERSLAHSPLFQVMFVLQNMMTKVDEEEAGSFSPAARGFDVATAESLTRQLDLPNLQVSLMPIASNEVQFDLVLTLAEASSHILGALEYDAHLLDATTIERFLRQWKTLLQAAIQRPELPCSELSLFDDRERHQLLVEWNDTATLEVPAVGLHQLFEAQVKCASDAVALVWREQSLSYGELERHSRALALALSARGVGPEKIVALSCERSPAMVIGLLGILRAGGAYAPLDPSYPQERRATILEDSGARLLLTTSGLAAEIAEWARGIEILSLETAFEAVAPPLPADRGAEPGNLAYLIYTSGSTGRPKGVAITHRSAVAFAHWAREVFSETDWGGVLFGTSINFDVSIFELFVPLAWGGRVILAENALALSSISSAEAITLLSTVPSAMAELLREGKVPSSVRTVNLAGEPLSQSLADQTYALPNVERVYNFYGPSEDTTYSTFSLISRFGGKPAIGRPLSGTRGYVLDSELRPVPLGVPGELYLGGAGLARGYWRRPELTAERFVPAADGWGERFYRTGDRVRYSFDGQLEFLGRMDFQVKIRGFRIELGEIEAVLSAHSALRDAVVLVGEIAGDRRLTAYCVAEEGAAPSESELREYLRGKLPEVMIPAAFVLLEAMPLTPNGKLDRRALEPLALSSLPAAVKVDKGARTPTQELLTGIWNDVLSVEGTGLQDSFFALGGHSLLATRVVSRVRETFGIDLPLRELFEAPVLAELAKRIEAALQKRKGTSLPPIVAVPRTAAPLPLSFAQERLWFLEHLRPESAAYNVPVALRIAGDLHPAALQGALSEMLRRHEVLRTTFEENGGQPVQRIHPPRPIPLPWLDLSGLETTAADSALQRLVVELANRPFDLARGPLVRACLLRFGTGEHVLFLGLHHIVADGWSMEVLVRETTGLYNALSAGRPSPLPPLPIQYADYAVWQRRHLQGDLLAREKLHWQNRLQGAPTVTILPADRPRSVVHQVRGETHHAFLPPDLVSALTARCRHGGVTLFMALAAGLAALVRRWSAQDDVVLGTPIAGRNHLETEGLIGFFLNTLVLRFDLSGAPDLGELLTRIRERTLEAYAHQDFPFEKLVAELSPERDLSHAPFFQMLVTLQNQPAGTYDLPGLRLSPVPIDVSPAKFDLTLNAEEDEGGLGIRWLYNAELFDRSTVERWTGHFKNFLRAVVSSLSTDLTAVLLLSASEEQQLREWNATTTPAELPLSMSREIAAQAARIPHAVVISGEDLSLTYGELHVQAGRLAEHLRRKGVGNGDRVGLALGRSAEFVSAALGVLRAGAAYVPLDPSYPGERLAAMVGDADLCAVVSLGCWAEALALDRWPVAQILLDASLVDARAHRDELVAEDTWGDWIYTIFTSGSTGRPKGASVFRRSFESLLGWYAAEFELGSEDRFLLLTSVAFDLTQKNLFAPLMTGGLLVLQPEPYDPAALAELIEREGITRLNCTPSAFYPLLGSGSRLSSLRSVFLGGEPISPARLESWRTSPFCRAEIVNTYGPTECTDVVASHRLASLPDEIVPLGRPLPSARLWVLDAGLSNLPVGAPGQLGISGLCVGAGYLGERALTAARFLPDPFSTEPGARLYLTGDLALRRIGGEIQYLGRIDHQVKVRGFRIELGEIETTLSLCSGVRGAVVLAREEGGEPRLTAYVSTTEGAALTAAELRRQLATTLPEYMVPASWVFLSELPLSPNGKVDRRALQGLNPTAGASRESRGPSGAPRTALESFLADLWHELIGVESIGIHDDFFEIGGSSISGAVLINRLQQELGEIVHVVVIFDASTIERLAAYLVREHPATVARRWGGESLGASHPQAAPATAHVDAAQVTELRRRIVPLSPMAIEPKNPRAVFLLSPPRSGSTLLRVMLGGHPQLFAPPELELLSFNTLAERRAAYSGRDSFWLEGAIRAVMEAFGYDVDAARSFLDSGERKGWSTQRLYRELQQQIGDRLLVDKSPSYALDLAVLRRAEQTFEAPLYIHLVRHPGAVLHSFTEARLEQVFFRFPHGFSRRELGELIWVVSQQNILQFLAEIAASRQIRVSFEELVRDPETALRRICAFCGIGFHPDMAEPYKEKQARMTDGLYAESRMVGDVKFYQHRGVEVSAAEEWRHNLAEESLGDVTWQVAEALGYRRQEICSPLVLLRGGDPEVPPLFLVHPVGGNVLCYGLLARRLGGDRRIYGLQAPGLHDGATPLASIDAMTDRYLAEIRGVCPDGPYHLAGWSLGGVIAFSIARCLEEAGKEVGMLALLDSTAPPETPQEVPDLATLLFGLAVDLAGLEGGAADFSCPDLGDAPVGDSGELVRWAQEHRMLPADLMPEQAESLWNVFQTNVRAARRYTGGSYRGRVHLLKAVADSPLEEREAAILAWQRWAAALTVEQLALDHYALLREPGVGRVADWLRSILA